MSQEPVSPIILEPADRPGSVTTMAILGIIFGALGFICTPLSLIPYFIPMPQANPYLDAIKNNSLLYGWTMMAYAVGWLLSIALLSGSIAALGLREWARQVLIGWSIMALLLAVAQMVVNAIYLQPLMQKVLQSQSNNPAAAAGAVGGIIGIIMGILLGIGFPGVMLFFMTRAKVKDAFARGLRRVI